MAIRHKRTTTTGYTWQSSDLVEGQIGLNLTDGTAHMKKADGNIVPIGKDNPAGSNQQIQYNNNGAFGASSGLTYNGTDLTVNGVIKSTQSAGDEGGEIQLALAATNTTLNNSVAIDINQNRLRIFETGGSNRGVYVDLTAAGTGVGTNLLSGGGGISNVVEDTTPQLGGNLDVNGNAIVSASNGDIAITPNGTGSVIIDGNEFPQTQGEAGEVLTADGSGIVEWKLPQTISAQVYNADSVTINKGQPVYVFGSTGTNISVKLAVNTGDATSAQTLGLAAETITAGSTGIVVCQGLIKNVDTSSYTAGQALYLGSTAGAVTTTKPYAPNHLVYLGFVETVNAVSGRIYVRTQNGYELDEIHDVNIDHNVALADNHYLQYNSSNGLWENNALDIVNDTTPQLGGNLDVNGNSIVSVSNGDITLAPNGTGKVIISGDLQIDGTTTTINSTTLDVDDINITIAKGAANAAAANGGGITLEGPATAATITYASASDTWNMNKTLNANTSGTHTGAISTNSITGTTANADITITPNGTGDVVLSADTITVGDTGALGTISSRDGYNLTLRGYNTTGGSATLTLNGGDFISSYSYAQFDRPLRVASTGYITGTSAVTALTLAGYYEPTTGSVSGGQIAIGAAANSSIALTPDGTGDVLLNADTVRIGDSNANATLTTNGTGDLILNTNNGTSSGSITILDGANGNITIAPNGTGVVLVTGLHVGVISPVAGSSPITGRHQATGSATTGNYSLIAQKNRTDIALASMTNEPAVIGFQVRDSSSVNRTFGRLFSSYVGTGSQPTWTFQSSVDNFTTTATALSFGVGQATFGNTNTNYTITTNGTGDLILNTNGGTNSGTITILDGANANITLTPNGTGKTAITNLQYNEAVFAYGNSGTLTWTPDAANGNVQTITLTGNLTLNAFSNPVSGQTITFIITQDGTGSRTLTSTMKFAGGSKTLSTAANSIDILTVSYIGTTYYATLSKGYA